MILVYVQSELRERSFPATDAPSGDGLGFEDRAKRRPTGCHGTIQKKNIGPYPGESQSSTAFQVARSLAPLKKDHLRPKSTVYTSTNNHLGWELGGTGVLGVGTGDRGLIHGDGLQ